MVTTFYPPYHFGGDAVCVRRLAHALVRRGHEVDVVHDIDAFAMRHPGPMPAPSEHPPGLRVHGLRSRLGRLSCLATHQTGRPLVHGRRIRRILESGGFDVIQFHNVSLVGGLGVLAYGDCLKLYLAHEHWLVCPTHSLWRHGREVCDARECLRCVLHYRRPPQLWRRTGLLAAKAEHIDAFISPSRHSAEMHHRFGFTRPFEVIPHFLPDRDTHGGADGHAVSPLPDRPYFLFAGRLEKLKGVQDLLPHFGEDGPADLFIAGTGSYEPELRAAAAALPRVRFLGWQTSSQLRALYTHAIAVLVPSVCYETFGIVILEAFRDHTAVVARALGPMTEIVRESGGGLLFETADQLSAALHLLATDPQRRAELAEAAHRAFLECWTEHVVLQKYWDLLRRLARQRDEHDLVTLLNDWGGLRVDPASVG